MARTNKLIEARRKRRQRNYFLVGMAIASAAGIVAAFTVLSPSPPAPPPPGTDAYAIINTASGTIVFRFYEQEMPITAPHFMQLFESGYYNHLKWHRVEGFVIQTGQGPERSPIPLENPGLLHNDRSWVGVARTSDPNSGSTQFYILKQDSRGLDTTGGGYAIFGKVTRGMEVVDQVTVNEEILSATLVRSASPP